MPLVLTFQAAFEPLFAVRGLLTEQRGQSRPPRRYGQRAHRADGSVAVTGIRLEGQPEVVTESEATPAKS